MPKNTENNTLASRDPEGTRHCLPKAVLTTGLLAAFGSVLSAVPALALSTCTVASADPATLCTFATVLTAGDKKVTDLFGVLTTGTLPSGTTFTLSEAGNEFIFAFDFGGSPSIFLEGPATGYLEYTISIDPFLGAGNTFDTVKLESFTRGVGVGVEKTSPTSSFAKLISTDGSISAPIAIASGTTSMQIRDDFSVAAGGFLNSFNNVYTQKKTAEVPGPLPLLGAGAAFGWSRKLRKRVKSGPHA